MEGQRLWVVYCYTHVIYIFGSGASCCSLILMYIDPRICRFTEPCESRAPCFALNVAGQTFSSPFSWSDASCRCLVDVISAKCDIPHGASLSRPVRCRAYSDIRVGHPQSASLLKLCVPLQRCALYMSTLCASRQRMLEHGQHALTIPVPMLYSVFITQASENQPRSQLPPPPPPALPPASVAATARAASSFFRVCICIRILSTSFFNSSVSWGSLWLCSALGQKSGIEKRSSRLVPK